MRKKIQWDLLESELNGKWLKIQEKVSLQKTKGKKDQDRFLRLEKIFS